jgi:UDPglucose 6-dehydrogenase
MPEISILGAGVVGYATGLGLKSLGHDVTFVDVDADRLAALRGDGHRTQHVDHMTLDEVGAVFVSVPTPAGADGIDTTYLDQAGKTLARLLQGGRDGSAPPVFVFRSTMPPGTTRKRLIPAIEAGSGKKAGVDFLVCYNPEYLRAANAVSDFLDFKFLTLGTAEPGDAAAIAVRTLFAGFENAVVTELTFEEAEYQKYVHNVYNAVKISYFNEMRSAARGLGLSRVQRIFELTARTAEAAWNPTYGIREAGPFGGACLPKDTAAWTGFAQQAGLSAEVVEAARSVNIALGGASC